MSQPPTSQTPKGQGPNAAPTFPQAPIASTELRDHASSLRVAAIWSRLEAGLPSGADSAGSFATRAAWFRVLVGGAVMAGVFALGVAVGANGLSPSTHRADADLALQAEPRSLGGERFLPGTTGVIGAAQAPRLSGDRGARSPRAKTNTSVAVSDVESAQQSLVIEQVVAPPVTPLWQLAAQQGEYQTALIELEANGGFEAVAAQGDADQLMLLADVARATGFRQRAVLAWRRVISQHATDPQAPLAAWSLGNMLEKSGDTVGAAEAFAVYRNLSPQGDFAEDALAREIRMAVTQQNTQLANRLAAQYDQAFPNGRRAQEIREQLAKLQRQPNSTESVDAGVPEESTVSPK